MRKTTALTISFYVLPAIICIGIGGCTHKIKVDPIKVEPIHVTLDVNLKVDRELDTFFDFEEELAEEDGSLLEQPNDAEPIESTPLAGVNS